MEMGADERLLYDQLEAEGFADPDVTDENSDEADDGDSRAKHALSDEPAVGPMQLLHRLLRLRRVPFPLAPPNSPGLLLTWRPL